jgi:glucan 1,3-beta-glucosidase
MQTNNEKLRGVNLGGWLVLEKWMTPSLFAGTDAVDEYTLVRTLGAAEKITKHREEFITEDDFRWLQSHGINAVRLPVGFWVVDAHEPLLSTARYVDWVFAMAEKYNMYVVLCMHGAYGSQNGQDHSGRVGPIKWYMWRHRKQTRRALIELAQRYGHRTRLWGIELLNEPLRVSWWRSLVLRQWSRQTIHLLNKRLRTGCYVLFSDAFRPDRWSSMMDHYQAVMDVHHYQCFSDADKRLTIDEHIVKAKSVAAKIRRWQRDQPVIVGEWSLGLDEASLKKEDRHLAERRFAAAQVNAYADAAGWFFWNYKTESDDGWNFRYLVENDYFDDFTDKKVVY